MEIISKSVKDTLKIGKIIAKNLEKGDIICLFGKLGAGKTVLTKGIAAGLGIKKEKIISPTFVLIRQYNSKKFPLYHFDLYRLSRTEEIIALGYEEYLFDEGVAVIEWADRLKYLLPEKFLKVKLFIGSDSERKIRFIAKGQRYKKLLRGINEPRLETPRG